jgi:hypothetical protein
MALEVEGIVDDGMHAEETLGGSSRFEPPHLTLSPPHHLMRVFGAVVFPQPLLVRAGQSQPPERGGVRAQLVGDQQFGREALLLEQLAHQPQRRPGVTALLNQHVEDLALVIDGTPQVHPLGEAQVEPNGVLDDNRLLGEGSGRQMKRSNWRAPHRDIGIGHDFRLSSPG